MIIIDVDNVITAEDAREQTDRATSNRINKKLARIFAGIERCAQNAESCQLVSPLEYTEAEMTIINQTLASLGYDVSEYKDNSHYYNVKW